MGGKKLVTIDVSLETGERINSPRSLEACLRTGIQPEEILPKTVNDFWVRRTGKYSLVEKEAAVLRHQHFEQLRQAKIDALRKERDNILHEYETQALTSQSSPSPKKQETPRRAQSAGVWRSPRHAETTATIDSQDPDVEASTLLKLEQKRLERIKQRQQKEIQNVIEMEAKMAKLQQENARRAADELRRKQEYQRELRERREKIMAAKHEKEVAKKKQEDLEAAQRRERAKKEAEKERLLQEEEQRKEAERQKEAMLRELERAEKQEAFRKQTEALLKQQEDQVMMNRARMLERERQVVQKMEQASKKRHMEALEKRERATQRITHALMQNQMALHKRKQDFDEKQAAAAERAREIHRKTIAELKERSQKQKKEEEIRQKRLEQARQHYAQHVNKIMTKRQEMEAKLAQVYEEREKERMLHSVEKELTTEEKLKNVERMKRVDEYNRMQMIQRIAEEDHRTRAVKMKKQALMEARHKVALDAMLRKHKIAEAVEKLRISNKWDKIEETLDEEARPTAKSPSGFLGRMLIDATQNHDS